VAPRAAGLIARAFLPAAILAAPPVWLLLAPRVASDHYASIEALLAVALVYPVLEELCFRGWLQGWLLELLPGRRFGPVSLANLFTSLAFFVAHLAAQPLVWAIAVIAPSLVFGHLRERHGSVLPPVALHVYYNTGLLFTVCSLPFGEG
jgi:membrane protease YdiL (CAAX protease family)